ncbi:MAG: T9SS type A sorting domain-containing protein [Calditrichaeota bacterium]|nr:T9SS type A sorting domain-containing protein [Calditrichota bacterium]
MKRITTILTLCLALNGAAFGQAFTDATPHFFRSVDAAVVAWADVDGNGLADLFVGSSDESGSKLYMNFDRNWQDETERYSVSDITHVTSARFVDFDDDGRLDLLCITENESGVELYRLTENNRFQRTTLIMEQSSDQGVRSATWCDVDLDGSMDLLLSNRSGRSNEMVLLTRANDEYVEQRASDGPLTDLGVTQISPVDFDCDGDMDYFLAKRDGEASLWRYEDREYTNLADEMNLPYGTGQTGLTWADFNGDGTLDLFACGSESGDCMYYQFPGSHFGEPAHFENMSDLSDVRAYAKEAHSAHAVDVNGDGWTDLFLARFKDQGNTILLNRGGTGWRVWSGNPMALPGIGSKSAAWADFDNDGDLDCALAVGNTGVKLFRNDAVLPHEYIGLKFCGSNDVTTPVVGCYVEVSFPSGRQWASTSMYACQPGADGDTKYIYNRTTEHSEEYLVSVLWPNGLISTYDQTQINLWDINVLHMPYNTIDHGLNTLSAVRRPDVTNYPNPFNPTTNISFTLPEAANITLSVFNLLGQQVAVLASGSYNAGAHSLVFDASSLTSGLYLVRLEAPGQSVVHRILLAK